MNRSLINVVQSSKLDLQSSLLWFFNCYSSVGNWSLLIRPSSQRLPSFIFGETECFSGQSSLELLLFRSVFTFLVSMRMSLDILLFMVLVGELLLQVSNEKGWREGNGIFSLSTESLILFSPPSLSLYLLFLSLLFHLPPFSLPLLNSGNG